MDKILVSSCLLGNNTKYNGKNNYNSNIELLKKKYIIIPICPEVMGNLPIPRDPSEIINDKVITNKGNDVTDNFILGKNKVIDIINNNDIKFCILKDGSPSCGVYNIYDGSFTNNKIKGMGITTRELIKRNIKIYSEEDITKLIW